MDNDLLEFLGIFFVITVFVIVLIALNIGTIVVGGQYLSYYKLDNSMCRAFVNNEQVYAGRCHFIDISSIGENGNTKILTIYEDIACFKPQAKYINEKIEVTKF